MCGSAWDALKRWQPRLLPAVVEHGGDSAGPCTWYQAEASPRGLTRGLAKEP